MSSCWWWWVGGDGTLRGFNCIGPGLVAKDEMLLELQDDARKASCSKCFTYSELQNREKGKLGDFLIESIPKTCRGMVWCDVPPVMLSHTQVVKYVEVSMFSSFIQDMLHMVRTSLGKVLEAKEGSKVKAVLGVLVVLLRHLKIPTINKLTELSVGMKIQAQA